jgi:hypothetical protein
MAYIIRDIIECGVAIDFVIGAKNLIFLIRVRGYYISGLYNPNRLPFSSARVNVSCG